MKRSIKIAAAALVCVLLAGTAVGAAYIRSLPVSWDAGACGGGYATYIFDKYHEELTEKYCDGLEDDLDVSSVEAIRGTHEAEWEGQTLFLEFDVQYEHPVQGTVTERVGFIGQRTWIDTYDWGEAIPMADGDPQINGQDWFDEFRSDAERLSGQYDAEELEKMHPVSWLLLQMAG